MPLRSRPVDGLFLRSSPALMLRRYALSHRVNNITGERTYQFIRGKPVTPSTSPYVVQRSPMPSPHHVTPWAHSMASPAPPAPGYPAPLPPGYGGGGDAGSTGGANGAMVPYETGYGVPPVTPEGNGGWAHRLQKYYLRPSTNRSWMWN